MASAKPSVLGHDSDWWNGWVVASLALAAFAAIAVVVTTQIVIRLQGDEAREARESLERYKARFRRGSPRPTLGQPRRNSNRNA
jgi:hypothetical protein